MTRKFVLPFFLSVLIATIFAGRSAAQDSVSSNTATPAISRPAPPADPSLQGQYRDMLMRSRTQEGFKVINPNRLTTLWNNTMDSLNAERKKRLAAEQQLSANTQSLNAIKDSLASNQETLNESQTMINQVSLLGIPVEKTTYNLIMWGLVIVLALALVITLFQAGRHKKEATYRIQLFEDLSTEFQTHKTKANEREKKLARELQDERNKLDELINRDNK